MKGCRRMQEKIVGVVGGMGPEATVDFMRRVIRSTPANDDCDHIRMIVDNNPKIPSRIKALIDGIGESPGPVMAEMAVNLASQGAGVIVIPCNTAHFYYGEVSAAVEIPVLNMIELAVEAVISENPSVKTAGLLASDAVVKTGLYAKAFQNRDISLRIPSSRIQENLMSSILRIKRGDIGQEVKDGLTTAAHDLIGQGAQVLLVACTELSITADEVYFRTRVYDTAQVLAEATVRAVFPTSPGAGSP